jgi:hypothetical protein
VFCSQLTLPFVEKMAIAKLLVLAAVVGLCLAAVSPTTLYSSLISKTAFHLQTLAGSAGEEDAGGLRVPSQVAGLSVGLFPFFDFSPPLASFARHTCMKTLNLGAEGGSALDALHGQAGERQEV